jgi:hypothetical protein
MQNHAKHRSPFLYALSIAIVCGVAALNPNGAHAFPEHLALALGQYTIYQSGVSDQVPVSVKLKWIYDDHLNMIYSAYDNSNNLILSSNILTGLVTAGSTYQDNVTVPAGTIPVRFYAEAQGQSGLDDQMMETQLNNFTFGHGPFTLGQVTGLDQYHYKVLVAAFSPNAQAVRLDYTATNNLTLDPTFNTFALTANNPWVGLVGVAVGNNSPVTFNILVNQQDPTAPYRLGTKQVRTNVGDLTVVAGPTVHFGDWTIPIDNHVTLTQNANQLHTHMKAFFSARDEAGHALDCDPSVVKNLTYTQPQNPGDPGTWNGPTSVTVRDPELVHGHVTFKAILALYDNGDGFKVPPTYVEPSSSKTFGP